MTPYTSTADYLHPEKPVEIVGARITGVREKVAEHWRGQPLSALGVPVRASGLLGGPSVSVTVVRNEAGEVAYNDNTSVEWEQATWLARKVGVMTNATAADEHRGAQKLIEQDIMTKPAKNLVTDSED